MGIAGSGIALATPLSNIQTVSVNQIKANELHVFKLQPRFNVWGFTGDKTLAETQVLFPLKGDNNKVLYAIGEGNYTKNDSSWMAGLGFGYRQIVEGKILGGYLIADYVNTPQNGFVVANPGIEVLGFHDVWDFNVNGYIPLEKEKKLGKEGWAGEDFGDYSFGRASGHSFYDHKIQEFEEAGAGFDVEVGRTIPGFEKAKVYLGGYHFDSRESGSVNGIETRFTYDLNKYTTLELENNYDNLHKNKFIVGVRFGLGGYSQEEKQQFGLSTRLLDPIEHDHVVAIHEALVDDGEQLRHDNVWYFKQGNAIGDVQTGSGTAEDPLINFTQANYDVVYANKDAGILDSQPLMYFAPGQYDFSDFTTARDGTTMYNDRFALENGWGMYGRTSDYKARANGDDRARFDGGLDMVYDTGAGTNATTLDSVRIYNTVAGQANASLYIKNAGNVIFDNVYIDSNVSTGSSYSIGIYADNSTLNFNGGVSTINSYSSVSAYPHGIETDNSTINFNGGTNAITASSTASSSSSRGVYAKNSTLNFNGGTNAITASSEVYYSYGIHAYNSTLNFNGGASIINSSSSSSYPSPSSPSYGIYATNASTLNFNAGTNAINSSASYSYGIYATNASTLNFNGGTNAINSSVYVSSYTSSNTLGIYASNSTLNFNGGNNVIISDTATNNSTHTYGIYASQSTLNFNNSTPIDIIITNSGAGIAKTTTGIYAGTSSSIKYWNGSVFTAFDSSNIGNITNYVNFTKTVGSLDGSGSNLKVYWSGVLDLAW